MREATIKKGQYKYWICLPKESNACILFLEMIGEFYSDLGSLEVNNNYEENLIEANLEDADLSTMINLVADINANLPEN